MPALKDIAETVQQVAEAISHAIGLETEVVDHELTVVGGTGLYKKRLGEKEERGNLNGNFLYARVMRKGETEIVEEPCKDLTYDESSLFGKTKELAEVCTPIKAGGTTIGIIGLVAFKEEQRKKLIQNKENMVSFIERMAELLAAKASEKEAFQKIQIANNEITTILETIHEGVVAIDKNGCITHCNSVAEVLLKSSREEMIGKHLSVFMPGAPALEVLRTGKGYTEQEEIFRRGMEQFHFIVTAKPIEGKENFCGVVISFRDITEARKLVYNMSQRDVRYTFDDIIGNSQKIIEVKQQAETVARGNSTVLITGESGTGKEMFARAIHYRSSRCNGPFVTVNCGAIPETLLESELFGYEKGAFTGAREKGKMGKFELANGGTIFLDEIGDMPLHLQVKLLHVLQNMRFERVGGNKTICVDVRVIAATNRDLEKMIEEKEFREDLYYRLSVIPLRIPPLRKRAEDIPLLMNYFLKKYNAFMKKSIKGFSKEAKEIYLAYDWPGNVRELENAVEYGVNMTFSDEIGIEAVPPRLRKRYRSFKTKDSELSLQSRIKNFEREILLEK
ncbi:MAG TPA: sigma 54-interacting transcriptional regulator, partial [Clostridiales bacterium]|nr:sigma 54-interacting transcriptional regulator [Clostridiales bacterium]